MGSVHEYRTEGITKADEREGENEIGGGIEVGGGIGKRATGPGRVEERRVCARKSRRVVDVMWKTGETWAEGGKSKTQKYSFSSCRLGQYTDTSKEAEREVQGIQGLSKNYRCRGSVSSSSCLIKSCRNKYH